MTITVTNQAMICDCPLRFDTYEGCSHKCAYCFATRKKLQKNYKVKGCFSKDELTSFLLGKRNVKTKWIDWKLPLHWGGMSDPFQPCEKKLRNSYHALEILAKSQYPFVISTKGKLIADNEYLNLLKQCNCVVQISMLCSTFDKYEPGAPTFEERLIMLEKVSKVVKRTVVRCQPYLPELFDEVLNNIPRFQKAGAHGVIFEAMKFIKQQQGLEKLGGDYVFPLKTLIPQFNKLKETCHKNGLKFYSGENRLRAMGDDLCCCGFADLEGFEPNTFNVNHLLLDKKGTTVKEHLKMNETGSGYEILQCIHQRAGLAMYKDISFKQLVLLEANKYKKQYKNILTTEGVYFNKSSSS